MAKPPPAVRDAVTVVIPVRNAADRLDKFLPAWADALGKLGRNWEILVVDDGSTDSTPAAAEKLADRVRPLRVLRHEAPRGYGACLRTALAEAQHPLFFYTAADYPYTPADLRALLERSELKDDLLGLAPDIVSGCRTGYPAPPLVRGVAWAWRWGLRVVFGLHVEPRGHWPGVRGWVYRLFVKWVFAVPFADVNGKFRLCRTAFLRSFPIQSDGEFVHAELSAKATFLTRVVDEVPLTPKPAEPPPVPPVWKDMWKVLRNAEFGDPMGLNAPKLTLATNEHG